VVADGLPSVALAVTEGWAAVVEAETVEGWGWLVVAGAAGSTAADVTGCDDGADAGNGGIWVWTDAEVVF